MSQEIELKLTISRESIERFLSLSLLSSHVPQVLPLKNTYFDTDSQTLTQSGSALRIRKTPTGYLQTLKSRGQNIGGLHRRDEWEYPISENSLDLSQFPVNALPTDITSDNLKPLFSTNLY